MSSVRGQGTGLERQGKDLELYSRAVRAASGRDKPSFIVSDRTPWLHLHHKLHLLSTGTAEARLQLRVKLLVCVE